MNGPGYGGVVNRVVTGTLGLLVAAWAIYEAVHLIQDVWVALTVIVGSAVAIAAGLAWWRTRHGGW